MSKEDVHKEQKHKGLSDAGISVPGVNLGWATKIINVYLKTRVYIGAQGRHHFKEMIHPPIDAGLWLGLARRFPDRPDILEHANCVSRIKGIGDYEYINQDSV